MKLRAPCVPSLSDPLELSTMMSKPCAAAPGSNRRRAFGRAIGTMGRSRRDQVGRGFAARAMIGETMLGITIRDFLTYSQPIEGSFSTLWSLGI